MGAKSKIEWTEASWNPLRGAKGHWHCTHVSEGCRNCYAERMNMRFGGPAYKPGADEFRLDGNILEHPLRWRRPRRIFVCSMTDLFHEQIPDEWIDRIFAVMWLSFWHTHQLLTKRPERARDYLRSLSFERCRKWMNLSADGGDHAIGAYNLTSIACRTIRPTRAQPIAFPWPNVWLGVSAEDQKTADERIPLLLQTPASVRWVSAEPLLGPIHLEQDWTDIQGESEFDSNPIVNWVVCGGESGPGARPMHPDWARSLRDQCLAAGVPFFFKQGSQANWKRFKDFSSFPEDLQIREYPNAARG